MPLKTEKLVKSLKATGILDQEEIVILSGTKLPSSDEVASFAEEPEVRAILDDFSDQPDDQLVELHKLAKQYLASGHPLAAWKVLLQD